MQQRGPRQVVPVAVSEIQLPATPFLYTLDQVAILLAWDVTRLRKSCHFFGRSLGSRTPDDLRVMNLADAGGSPDWRVAENELLRWLIRKGYIPMKVSY